MMRKVSVIKWISRTDRSQGLICLPQVLEQEYVALCQAPDKGSQALSGASSVAYPYNSKHQRQGTAGHSQSDV